MKSLGTFVIANFRGNNKLLAFDHIEVRKRKIMFRFTADDTDRNISNSCVSMFYFCLFGEKNKAVSDAMMSLAGTVWGVEIY